MSKSRPNLLGKYELAEVVGEGAMGTVYRAVDPVLHREVAIKVMKQAIATDPQLRGRFLREARAAGRLQHPNIVTVYDFGEARGHLFIAMEYVPGSDLATLIRSGTPLSLDRRINLIIAALQGLGYAHGRGIIHRDVKPANIRVAEDGQVKIMDFGIAHLAGSDITGTGMVLGTPDYMAPELVRGTAVTPATDIFGIGAVLYELLTYQKPFPGDTVHTVLYKVVSEAAPPLRSVNPALPEELETVIETALAKEPGSRYPSAAAMIAALVAARGRLEQRDSAETVMVRRAGVTGVPTHQGVWIALGAAAVVAGALAAVRLGQVSGRGPGTSGLSQAVTPAAGVAPDSSGGVAADTSSEVTPDSATGAAADSSLGMEDDSAQDLATGVGDTSAVGPSPAFAPRDVSDSAFAPLRGAALDVRNRAVQAGARPAALAVGDSLARGAEGLAAVGRLSEAVEQLAAATARWQQARERAAQPLDMRRAVGATVARLVRAVQSRDVEAIRRVYPNLASDEQDRWVQFFQSTESIAASLKVAKLEVDGGRAHATISGVYRYLPLKATEQKREAVEYQATFERAAGGWRLIVIRKGLFRK